MPQKAPVKMENVHHLEIGHKWGMEKEREEKYYYK